MGFYVEDSATFTIGQAIYEAALIIAVLRWVLCFVFRVINDRRIRSSSLHTATPTEPASLVSLQMIRDNTLLLTTFGEISERFPGTEDTCAVCLNQLRMEDEVRELMNCYHVFHKECIDRWLDHEEDNNNDNNHHHYNPTCPLCRAPLLTPYCCLSPSETSSSCVPPSQPSWAVERLLYLFGDDLLPC